MLFRSHEIESKFRLVEIYANRDQIGINTSYRIKLRWTRMDTLILADAQVKVRCAANHDVSNQYDEG
jgi:hypothetical protein